MPLRIKLLLAVILMTMGVSAQTAKIDSLRLELIKTVNPIKEAELSNTISEAFYDTQLYPDSAYYYADRALTISKEHALKRQEARSLTNFGMVLTTLQQYEEALDYYQQANTLFTQLEDPRNLSVINSSIAAAYYEQDQFIEAIDYFEKAIAISIQEKDTIGMLIDHINLGECEYRIRRFEASKTHLEFAIEMMKQTNIQIAAAYTYYGNTLLALNEVERALRQGEKGLELAKEEQNIKSIMEASKLLFETHVAKDNYKEAIGYYEKFVVYKDSLNAARELNDIEKLRLNFDLSRKEKELAYISQKTKYLNAIYLLAAIGLILLVFVILKQRKVSRMTRDIHEIQMRFVKRELDERDQRKKTLTKATNFKATRAQDAKLKE